MFKRILLAIDDSPSGSAAVSFAVAMAKDSGAVHVVHVNELLVGGRGHAVETRQEATAVLDTAVAELQDAGVAATGVVFTAHCFNVAPLIAQAAADFSADVIVVGSRRRTRFAALRGKSMRERITGLTTLPVMTAPPALRVEKRGHMIPDVPAVPGRPQRAPVGF
jgi:nucleotide-binding universal stress UspA family protein